MYKGTSASAGIGIGKAVIVEEAELVITRQAVSDGEAEIQRFKGALEQTIKDTERLAEDLAVRVGEKEAEIMQGHMMLLSDPMLTGEIENSIKNDGVNSEFAIENVCNMYADMFASMGDELMQQRATDMRDIKTRMQRVLMGIQSVDISSLPAGSILVAKDLTPSMTAGINPANVTGIVTELGGRTSHSAILARALEIPAVVAVNSFIEGVKDGDDVVLDGSTGEVYVNPEADVKAGYEAKKVRFQEEKKELEQFIGKASVTKDGVRVEIVANIGKPEDVDKVLEYDGEGIGLFRTEFLFMDRTAMPTEDEQFEAYKKVAAAMNGKPVIIRTLDIGGDKEIPYMGLEKDENPFLGYRAIRFCLDRKEDVYKPQLRALLRERDITSALFDLGGNVTALGSKPDGSPWKVGVADPDDPGKLAGLLEVRDATVSTSGAYQRYFEGKDGTRYHHLLDPSTGYPAASDLASASVVGADGAQCDALSTACFVLGLDGALDLWRAAAADGDAAFDLVLIASDGRTFVTDGIADAYTPAAGTNAQVVRS